MFAELLSQQGDPMTAKTDFTDEEWKTILQGPPSAGMYVAFSQKGGSIRESFSMAKAYAEAKQQPGGSQLIDVIVQTKPEVDKTRMHSVDEMEAHLLENLQHSVALLRSKAEPGEVEEYGRFIIALAERVAEAHREGFLGLSGERVSDTERAAVQKVAETVGLDAPAAPAESESD
jgi:hypothetical protein